MPKKCEYLLEEIENASNQQSRSKSQIITMILEEYFKKKEVSRNDPRITDDLWTVWRPYIESVKSEDELKNLEYMGACIEVLAGGILKWRIYHNNENPVFRDLRSYDGYLNQEA